MKMFLLMCLLLLFGGQRSSACPHLCSCHGSQVDCSSRSLTASSLPSSFSAGTSELRLHNNLLTTLPNGLLDDLTSLRFLFFLMPASSIFSILCPVYPLSPL
uniref:LRRNT domain-containing protein n=1 Tax=Oreochromis niloticus TaxID=8128 RepID=A0A669E1M4_ORENI